MQRRKLPFTGAFGEDRALDTRCAVSRMIIQQLRMLCNVGGVGARDTRRSAETMNL
jgi:hypothetical protein